MGKWGWSLLGWQPSELVHLKRWTGSPLFLRACTTGTVEPRLLWKALSCKGERVVKLPWLILQFMPSHCPKWQKGLHSRNSLLCVLCLDHLPKFSKLASRKAVQDVAEWMGNEWIRVEVEVGNSHNTRKIPGIFCYNKGLVCLRRGAR